MFSKKSILLAMAILMVFSCLVFSISYAADAPIILKLAHADATDVFTSRKLVSKWTIQHFPSDGC